MSYALFLLLFFPTFSGLSENAHEINSVGKDRSVSLSSENSSHTSAVRACDTDVMGVGAKDFVSGWAKSECRLCGCEVPSPPNVVHSSLKDAAAYEVHCRLSGGTFAEKSAKESLCKCADVAINPRTQGCRDGKVESDFSKVNQIREAVREAQPVPRTEAELASFASLFLTFEASFCEQTYCCRHFTRDFCREWEKTKAEGACTGFGFGCHKAGDKSAWEGGHRINLVEIGKGPTFQYCLIEPQSNDVIGCWHPHNVFKDNPTPSADVAAALGKQYPWFQKCEAEGRVRPFTASPSEEVQNSSFCFFYPKEDKLGAYEQGNRRCSAEGGFLPTYTQIHEEAPDFMLPHSACLWTTNLDKDGRRTYQRNGRGHADPSTKACATVCYKSGCHPPRPQHGRGSVLSSGSKLETGERLYSPNGKYYAVLQVDNNLVVYNSVDRPLWSSNTANSDPKGNPRSALHMQSDGNLVFYSGEGRAAWASNTAEKGKNCHAQVQDDGNFVVYCEGDKPVWSSGTF